MTRGGEVLTGNIIVKPFVRQQFERFMQQGRVLFFSAPCCFGKTTLAEALLRGQNVLSLSAEAEDFAFPPADGDWHILLWIISSICRGNMTGRCCVS